MYTAYFGFREEPFSATPDPRLFYSSPMYREAYANLFLGIRARKGLIALTGEVGTGKTTLLKRLMLNLEVSTRFVFVYNAALTFDELLSFTCSELGLPVTGSGRLEKIGALNTFLISQLTKGGTTVLLIDEAQHLKEEVLEQIRLLSNLETTTQKLLQIVLVGQPELTLKLNQPSLRQVKQRIALQCQLAHLKDREVSSYIDFRLAAVGYQGRDLFSPDAVRAIAAYSRGIPRLINIICDSALLIAYATSQRKVSTETISEVARDLDLKARERTTDIADESREATTRWSLDSRATARRSSSFSRRIDRRAPARLRASIFLTLAFFGVAGTTMLGWYANAFGLASIQQSLGLLGRWTLPSTASVRVSERQEPGDVLGESAQLGAVQVAQAPQERPIVIGPESTIAEIANAAYGRDTLLGLDLVREFNPHIESLNRPAVGQRLWLPPLTRETLLREGPDGSYHLILASLDSPLSAERLGQAIRHRGYSVTIVPRKVADDLLLHRVEIRGLTSLAAANRAWDTALASSWLSVTADQAGEQPPGHIRPGTSGRSRRISYDAVAPPKRWGFGPVDSRTAPLAPLDSAVGG